MPILKVLMRRISQNGAYSVGPLLMNDLRYINNLSDGAKHPRHRDINTQPFADDALDGLFISCLTI